ncbi:MAG: hypothetical protein AAGD22_11015 [Verrucomicrobiota bacterium]
MKIAAPSKSSRSQTATPKPANPLYSLANHDSLKSLEDRNLAILWILALHDPHPSSPALAIAIANYLESHSLPLELDDAGLTILPHAVLFTDDLHNEWQLCRLDPASSDLHFLCNDFLVQVLHFDDTHSLSNRAKSPI